MKWLWVRELSSPSSCSSVHHLLPLQHMLCRTFFVSSCVHVHSESRWMARWARGKYCQHWQLSSREYNVSYTCAGGVGVRARVWGGIITNNTIPTCDSVHQKQGGGWCSGGYWWDNQIIQTRRDRARREAAGESGWGLGRTKKLQ